MGHVSSIRSPLPASLNGRKRKKSELVGNLNSSVTTSKKKITQQDLNESSLSFQNPNQAKNNLISTQHDTEIQSNLFNTEKFPETIDETLTQLNKTWELIENDLKEEYPDIKTLIKKINDAMYLQKSYLSCATDIDVLPASATKNYSLVIALLEAQKSKLLTPTEMDKQHIEIFLNQNHELNESIAEDIYKHNKALASIYKRKSVRRSHTHYTKGLRDKKQNRYKKLDIKKLEEKNKALKNKTFSFTVPRAISNNGSKDLSDLNVVLKFNLNTLDDSGKNKVTRLALEEKLTKKFAKIATILDPETKATLIDTKHLKRAVQDIHFRKKDKDLSKAFRSLQENAQSLDKELKKLLLLVDEKNISNIIRREGISYLIEKIIKNSLVSSPELLKQLNYVIEICQAGLGKSSVLQTSYQYTSEAVESYKETLSALLLIKDKINQQTSGTFSTKQKLKLLPTAQEVNLDLDYDELGKRQLSVLDYTDGTLLQEQSCYRPFVRKQLEYFQDKLLEEIKNTGNTNKQPEVQKEILIDLRISLQDSLAEIANEIITDQSPPNQKALAIILKARKKDIISKIKAKLNNTASKEYLNTNQETIEEILVATFTSMYFNIHLSSIGTEQRFSKDLEFEKITNQPHEVKKIPVVDAMQEFLYKLNSRVFHKNTNNPDQFMKIIKNCGYIQHMQRLYANTTTFSDIDISPQNFRDSSPVKQFVHLLPIFDTAEYQSLREIFLSSITTDEQKLLEQLLKKNKQALCNSDILKKSKKRIIKKRFDYTKKRARSHINNDKKRTTVGYEATKTSETQKDQIKLFKSIKRNNMNELYNKFNNIATDDTLASCRYKSLCKLVNPTVKSDLGAKTDLLYTIKNKYNMAQAFASRNQDEPLVSHIISEIKSDMSSFNSDYIKQIQSANNLRKIRILIERFEVQAIISKNTS